MYACVVELTCVLFQGASYLTLKLDWWYVISTGIQSSVSYGIYAEKKGVVSLSHWSSGLSQKEFESLAWVDTWTNIGLSHVEIQKWNISGSVHGKIGLDV